MVEMIPIDSIDICLEPADTSIMMYGTKLFFFKRKFEKGFGKKKSSLKLYSYDLENNEDKIEKEV